VRKTSKIYPKNVSTIRITMGRRTKATAARINNFSRPVNPQNPTVEEVSDDDMDLEDDDFLEHGFFFLDEEPTSEDSDDCDSDDEDVDEDELKGLQNEADIEHFNAVLAHAQAMAVKAEREAAGEKPKRKRHYMGNSVRTKRHHAQKRRELAATGQKLISSMFTKTRREPTLTEENEAPQPPPDVIEIDSDSSDEGDDEIEASLNQLFPGEHEVSVLRSTRAEVDLTRLNQASEPEGSHTSESDDSAVSAAAARKQVEELLRQLREGRRPKDDSPETTTDQFLNGLCYKDFPALRRARAKLTVKAKDRKLDVFFRSRITAMVATLNFYLDPELSYLWRESLVLAVKALGRGVKHAQNLQKWINKYLHLEKLSLHRYGSYHSSILKDEDFQRDLQLHLMEIARKGYIRAQDIVDYVATPEVQQQLGTRAHGIHIQTAQRWLHKLSWRY